MDCKTNHIKLEDQLNAMVRDAAPLFGLPIVEVSGHEENALNCGKNHLSFKDLLAASIGVDGCGKPALRVKIIDSCNNAVNCQNNSAEQFNNIFAYDSTLKTIALVLNRST